eukprot:2337782-Rhodomonas_salina.9
MHIAVTVVCYAVNTPCPVRLREPILVPEAGGHNGRKARKAQLKSAILWNDATLCRIVTYYAVDYACFGFPEPGWVTAIPNQRPAVWTCAYDATLGGML